MLPCDVLQLLGIITIEVPRMSSVPRKTLSYAEVKEYLRRAGLRDINIMNSDANAIIASLAHTLLETTKELEELKRQRNINR